jgi:AcrR family transcriptional regulator
MGIQAFVNQRIFFMAQKSKDRAGRINQKHRTRNALLEAAAKLMQDGQMPTIEEVADAALVSRATAYRYFPTSEHVLAGTVVLKANQGGEAKLEQLMLSDDVAIRLDGVVRTFCERFSNNEVAYRALLRVLLQPISVDEDTDAEPRVRASRQVYWLNVALTPIQPQIGQARFERLVAALIGVTGFEAFIALRDVSSLEAPEATKIMCWSAQVLLQASLSEIESG